MTEIVAAHLERVAQQLAEQIYIIEYGPTPEHRGFFEVEGVTKLLAAALAACAREEHVACCYVCLDIAGDGRPCKRRAALERAVGEKGQPEGKA